MIYDITLCIMVEWYLVKWVPMYVERCSVRHREHDTPT